MPRNKNKKIKNSLFRRSINKQFLLTNEELRKIAEQKNKSLEEIINEYRHALKELEYSKNRLHKIIKDFGYKKFSNTLHLYGYGKHGELKLKYLCYDNLKIFNKIPKNEIAIVTGFGPTNPPTAGTLASIFRVLELQKHTGIYTHIIISELSALNSRQKPLNELIHNAYQFISFIKKLGFDEKNGEIRTHNYHDHSRVFALVSSVLTTKDLLENREVTYKTYKRLRLLGNDFSRMVSRAFTISDILLPIIRDKKRGVIVPVGLEEHHHPFLARIVLERLKVKFPNLVRKDAEVGALFSKIIPGLFPYVKMSKSIPDSSISIGDTVEELYRKIIHCGERNEEVILQMIILASNWDIDKIRKAIKIFKNLKKDYKEWMKIKYEYLNFFINIKNLWEESKSQKEVDVYKELFKK
jgi:tryptophanyl-tRNA synthetase